VRPERLSKPGFRRRLSPKTPARSHSDIEALAADETERLLDEALAASFPASDPVAAAVRSPKPVQRLRSDPMGEDRETGSSS